MEKNKDFLGTQPVGKLLFKLAIPTVIAQLINMLYNIVDRIFIGHIPDAGSLALTGVGVTMPIIMIVSAFAGLVSSGGAPRASISMGKGDMDSAEQTLGGCFLLQVIVSIILTAVLLLFGENLLSAFGASENTIEYAVSYLNIYALGTLFVQLTLGMNAFVTAEGFTKVSMVSVAIGAILNIALDPIMIFGLNMGVRGAALATVGLPVCQVVNIRDGFRRQKSFKLPVGAEQENRLRILAERFAALQRVHNDAGINDSSHIRFSLSSFASSNVTSAGRIPNRDLAMSTLS